MNGRVDHADLRVGVVYDVDLNGLGVQGEFTSRLVAIHPDGDGWCGSIEFENDVSLSDYRECRFWEYR